VGQSVVSLGTVQGDLQDVGLDQLKQKVLIRRQLSGCRINRLHVKILHCIDFDLAFGRGYRPFYLRQPPPKKEAADGSDAVKNLRQTELI
jgi:hypothetical protein